MVRFLAVGLALVAIGSATAAPPKADAEKSAANRDKVICKQFPTTGSLVETYRSCKTKSEWDRERENLRTLSVSDSCRLRANGGSCGF